MAALYVRLRKQPVHTEPAPFNPGPRLPEMLPAKKFAVLVLWHAQEDGATELVIEQPDVDGQVPIHFLVNGTWYDMNPFPGHIRKDVAQAIMRLAGLSDTADYPVGGDIDTRVTEEVHLRWRVTIAALDDRVYFRRLP